MPRFFVESLPQPGNPAVLTGECAAHAKVLRLKIGEAVTLCDGQGMDLHCEVISCDGKTLVLDPLEQTESSSEPKTHVSLFLSFPKADKLEHVIQKGTELGAYEICAFPSSRCVSKPDAKALKGKLERWKRIAASAAEQSGRGRIPAIRIFDTYEQALLAASSAELPLFPYENEHTLSLSRAVGNACFSTVSIMTGPEGGFSSEEVLLAEMHNMKICSLGPRILRCETAPLCALSAVLYATGSLD